MSDLTQVKAGDAVWVTDRRRRGRPVRVLKVGRIYLSLEGYGQANRLDGRMSSCYEDRAWVSENDAIAGMRADDAWRELSRRITYGTRPPNLGFDAIAKIADMLGFSIVEKAP